MKNEQEAVGMIACFRNQACRFERLGVPCPGPREEGVRRWEGTADLFQILLCLLNSVVLC